MSQTEALGTWLLFSPPLQCMHALSGYKPEHGFRVPKPKIL